MDDLRGWQMTFTEFNKCFEANMNKAPTYTEAYNMTEELHEDKTGERRYSDYDSFRKLRSRKIK